MEKKDRVLSEIIEVPYEETHRFFDRRMDKHNAECAYTAIMYQDQNPELVLERDAYEKDKILPSMAIQSGAFVFDIGCGVGRWADALEQKDIRYLGIDFSEKLLAAAAAKHTSANFLFQQIGAHEFTKENLSAKGPFTHVICTGIFMYLNDRDVVRCLGQIASLSAPGAVLYVRESVAFGNRLTLNGYYSAELKDSYTSIYRTVAEYDALLEQGLRDFYSWSVERKGELFDTPLRNRKETTQYYYMLRRAAF